MGNLVAHRVITRALEVLTFIVVIFPLVSCDSGIRERPFGDLRLGHIKDFPVGETFLRDKRFLIRHDANGFSAMSTLCTHDLSPLTPDANGEYSSEFNPSRYDRDGRVIRGPAKKNLPYYRLILDQNDIDQPREYLFVRVGSEVSPEWRLNVD